MKVTSSGCYGTRPSVLKDISRAASGDRWEIRSNAPPSMSEGDACELASAVAGVGVGVCCGAGTGVVDSTGVAVGASVGPAFSLTRANWPSCPPTVLQAVRSRTKVTAGASRAQPFTMFSRYIPLPGVFRGWSEAGVALHIALGARKITKRI